MWFKKKNKTSEIKPVVEIKSVEVKTKKTKKTK